MQAATPTTAPAASIASTSDTSESPATTGETSSPPLTSSQEIAQAVLAGQAESSTSTGTSAVDLSKLGAALEASGSNNPIQVSIIERTWF